MTTTNELRNTQRKKNQDDERRKYEALEIITTSDDVQSTSKHISASTRVKGIPERATNREQPYT
jgi:hypothetical protein